MTLELQGVLLQLVLAVCGLSALWMATGTSPVLRKWSCAVGLLGQPAWLAYAWSTQGWGLMVLSAAYSFVYLRGLLVALDWWGKKP